MKKSLPASLGVGILESAVRIGKMKSLEAAQSKVVEVDRDRQKRIIRRARTAIQRYRCSKPVAIALADGMINRATSVFDYGCGRGGDVQFLRSKKIRASGWDPHYYPDQSLAPADVVNLGYVLNVIEDAAERTHTLRRAFELARRVAVVSVRVDRALEEGAEYGDGLLTGTGTFQKLFTQDEFRLYLQSALKRHAYLIAPGIAYVFRDDSVESQFLATKAFTRRLEYRTDLIEEFCKNKLARRFVRLASKLGRLPAVDEFPNYDKLLAAFGSADRLQRLTLQQVSSKSFEESRRQRREDVLTYLAMLRLQGLAPPLLHALPAPVRNDIKGIWRTYSAALSEGEQFLFSLGNPEAVRDACRLGGVGKLLPQDFYIHASAADGLPALIRLVIFAAWLIIGEISYDVVKISTDGRAVSFLKYENFDQDAHPALLRSVRVYMPRAIFSVRDYSDVANPPILHRKDLLVRRDYPHIDKFRRLTEAEEKLGLLSEDGIGFRARWAELLEARGAQILGHAVSLRP
jgi:DNA phosphorothioation-associated putative methyltransferase